MWPGISGTSNMASSSSITHASTERSPLRTPQPISTDIPVTRSTNESPDPPFHAHQLSLADTSISNFRRAPHVATGKRMRER